MEEGTVTGFTATDDYADYASGPLFVPKQVTPLPRAAARWLLSLVALITAACSPAACEKQAAQRFEYSEVAMGVRARIVAYTLDEESATRACRAAFDRIAYLEDVMSDYRPSSDLMRLCAKSGGPASPASPELLFILGKCREMSLASDGAFDATVGPMVNLWRATRKSGKLPTAQELDAVRPLVDWRNVVIDEAAGTVRLRVRDMRLDLGGIAKGYACDEALRVLKARGIKSALVEIGGDIAVGAPPPDRTGWKIDVPNAPASEPSSLMLSNAAISSSGDAEQYVEIGGVRYSHIVDPRTGLGLTDRIAVTVVAPDGVTSDALATAISVLGEHKGRALARRYKGASVYIRKATAPP